MDTLKTCVKHDMAKSRVLTLLKCNTLSIESQMDEILQGAGVTPNLKHEWVNDKFLFSIEHKGIKIDGFLLVQDEEIDVDINVPIVLRVFEDKIRNKVENIIVSIIEKEVS